MTVFIVITFEKCRGTDFPPSVNAVPFRSKRDADAYRDRFLRCTPELGWFNRSASVVKRNVK